MNPLWTAQALGSTGPAAEPQTVMPTDAQGESYTFRKAAAADAAELARLRWEFRAEEQPRQARAEFVQACEAWLHEALASDRWLVAVAESETGSLHGCMYLQFIDKVPVPGGIRRFWGYVTNAYVVSEQRGKGVGRKLLSILIDEGRTRGLEFLIVWPSNEAVSLYQRAGFRSVSEAYSGLDDDPPLELVL